MKYYYIKEMVHGNRIFYMDYLDLIENKSHWTGKFSDSILVFKDFNLARKILEDFCLNRKGHQAIHSQVIEKDEFSLYEICEFFIEDKFISELNFANENILLDLNKKESLKTSFEFLISDFKNKLNIYLKDKKSEDKIKNSIKNFISYLEDKINIM